MTAMWVPRSAWTNVDARGGNNPHNGPKAWAVRPARTVVVHYVGSKGALKMPNPVQAMNSIQSYGWNRDGAGIEYGAVTFHDGSTWGGFEGEVGAHCATKDPSTGRAWNYSSWGICAYLGQGNTEVPDAMMEGLVFGIRHAQACGWVAPNPDIIGHRDTGFATDCPGPALYPRLPEIRAALAAPTPTPDPGDDDMYARRFRFFGYHNVFLTGAGPIQPVTPEVNADYDANGAPPVIVCAWHEQTVEAIKQQCGPQVWVPSGE